MKKLLVLLFVLLLAPIANAQNPKMERPDYQRIKKDIEEKGSEYYYSKLMKRLAEKDTTMTLEHYRHLYYGYVFQKSYEPYAHNPTDEQLKKYFQSEDLAKEDLKKVISVSEAALKEDPFDLRVMNFLAYVYHLNGNIDMSKKTVGTFHNLIDVIMSTGDGLKCETAFHVLTISHEYVLLNLFELESISQSLTGNCDYIAFEKGKYKIEGLYFDISKMHESMIESLGK